jgi:hypothetical protein
MNIANGEEFARQTKFQQLLDERAQLFVKDQTQPTKL